jgi:hypothetical protein
VAAARNRIGVTYGWLVCIARAPKPENTSHRLSWWVCQCTNCGKYTTVRADELDNGSKRSCVECRAEYQLGGIFPNRSLGALALEPEPRLRFRISTTTIGPSGTTTRFGK